MDELKHVMSKSTAQYEQTKTKYVRSHYTVVEVSGEILSEKDEFLDTFAKTLRFPDYFGRNWDGLRDMLTDLSWLESKSTAILVKQDEPLQQNPDYRTLLDILNEAAGYWRERNVSFDVVVFKDL